MKTLIIIILFLFYLSPVFALLSTPSLTSPAIGSINNEPNVLLDWSSITGATGYEYKLNTSPTLVGASIITVTGSSQASTSNLLFGTVYYWQVRAIKTSIPIDSSSWSAIWNFTTTDQVTLVSPSIGATNQAPNVILDWNPLTGITYYDYQWDTTATFTSPLNYYGSVATGSSQINTSNLRFGTKYYWRARVRHIADTTQWTSIWNFTTTDQLTLVSPTNGATNQTPDVILDWSILSGITYYDYQWDTTATFTSPLNYYGSVATGSSQINTSNLRFGTKYYWRARARHAADTTQWSATWNYTTIDYLTHVSPANTSIGISLNPLIDWTGILGITGYQYRYSTNIIFSNPNLFTIGATSQANLSSLSYGTQYYWQVRTFHATDTSEWSLPWSFTTVYQLTTAPSLISPANSAINIPVAGTSLQWSSISSATFYEYQFDDNTSFTSPVTNTVTALNDFTGTLLPNTTYYWKVRAGNGSGYSPWSVIWSFTTELVTGITYQLETENFSVYPNPSNGKFIINSNGNINSIEIYNICGEKIFQSEFRNQKSEIDLSAQPAGIYFYQITNKQQIIGDGKIILK